MNRAVSPLSPGSIVILRAVHASCDHAAALGVAIPIRCESTTPVYLQIVHAVIDEIGRGRLSSGAAPPGTRELAEAWR